MGTHLWAPQLDKHCANGDFPSSLLKYGVLSVWTMFGLNYLIKSQSCDCACMCVFVHITTVNCIWVCYICGCLPVTVFMLVYMTHFLSLFILLCLFVAVHMHMCVFILAALHAYRSVCELYGKFIPLCLRRWVRFSSAQTLYMVWAKPELLNPDCSLKKKKKTIQCFPSWHLQYTSNCTIVYFSFLSSLLHHWCGSSSEAPGQIQFLDDSLLELSWFN